MSGTNNKKINNKRWLGQATPFARQQRIGQLDPVTDYPEITRLFYADFMSIMLSQSFNGFMLTFAAPRMSALLASTGEVEQRFAKRFVDTALFARSIMEQGFDSDCGRSATRRVNTMHRQFDIHPDDFVIVGVDAALASLELAEKFGWREVTEGERDSIVRYYNRESRAFGCPRSLPSTVAEMRSFWNHYLDTQLAYAPQNERLARVALEWYLTLFPLPLRPLFRRVLLANVDERILRACGMRKPSSPMQWASNTMMKLLGRRDPLPDGTPDGLEDIVKRVYPDGWKIEELGPCPRHNPAGAELDHADAGVQLR